MLSLWLWKHASSPYNVRLYKAPAVKTATQFCPQHLDRLCAIPFMNNESKGGKVLCFWKFILSLMYMRSQEECIRSLEQEVQIHPQWVLVTKLYSFGRAANNLNHWASSSALKMHFNAAASSSSCRNGSESWGVASLPYCGSVEFSYWVLQNENPQRELWVVSEHLNLQGVKKWDRKDTPGRIPRRPVTC